MRPPVRRALVFVGLVAVGLGAVLWFGEDPVPASRPVYGKVDDEVAQHEVIRTIDEDRVETQIKLGEVVYPVSETVELPDGTLAKRTVYRLHVKSARSDPDGRIVTDTPHVTLLEPLTGETRGTVTAELGVLVPIGGATPQLGLGLADLEIEAYTLTGSVHGEMPLGDAGPATFDTEELVVREGVYTAPGDVVVVRDTMELRGTGMTWDEGAGHLALEVVESIRLTGATGAILHSPGGLVWEVGADGEGRGFGTLLGPVTGEADDGSRLAGDRLQLSDDASAITLVGNARVELVRADVRWALTSERATFRSRADAGWELTRAVGDVRVVSDDMSAPVWLETDRLDGRDGSLVAEGPVRGAYGVFDIDATGLRWDEDGSLELGADVVLVSRGEDASGALPGARITAPGGVTARQDADGAVRAVFRGLVEGDAPGLGAFRCGTLTYDEPGAQVVLDGDAFLELIQDAGRRTVAGARVLVAVDEGAVPTAITSRGDALVEEFDADGAVVGRLQGPWVELTSTRVRAPERFTFAREGLEAAGEGLVLDETAGHLAIRRDARLSRDAPDGGRDWIEADGGADWWMPKGAGLPPQDGRGSFRGPVRAATADGTRIEGGALEVDGALGRLVLEQDASVVLPDGTRLASDLLDLVDAPEGRRLRSTERVTFERDGMSGHGTGLDYDEVHGELSFERDVFVRMVDADGSTRQLECTGTARWTTPPGSVDPMAQGVGEFRGDVEARDGDGSGFAADRALVDMARRQLELFGECTVLRLADGELHSLQTEPSGYVRAQLDAAGTVEQASARGRLRFRVGEIQAHADEMDWNVPADHLKLTGDCRVFAGGIWMNTSSIDLWPGEPRWVIPPSVNKITKIDDER